MKYLKIISFIFLLPANAVLAYTSSQCTGDITNPDLQRYCGDYRPNDLLNVIISGHYLDMFFGVCASLALLFFIIGGVMFLISGGNQDRITKGKQFIIGAALGLIVVFTSYTIVQFTLDAMGIEPAAGGRWANSGWWNPENNQN